MKKYIKHIVLFLLPLLVYGAVVRWVDPYNYFQHSALSSTTQKEYAYPINRTLYRLIEFNQSDKTKVLIGDSRLNYIGALTDTANSNYFNFSSGGATMYQMLDVFNYAVADRKIDKVVFQVGFDDFNEQQDVSEIPHALSITSNPLLYIYSISNLKVMYHLTKDKLLGTKANIGNVKMDKDTYWETCLKNELEFHTAQNYIYGDKLKQEMKAMAHTCDRLNIKLTFVLLPVHQDVLSIIKEKNGVNYNRFKQAISEIAGNASFIDFSELPVIHDRDAFSDPYHLADDTTRMMLFKQLTGY